MIASLGAQLVDGGDLSSVSAAFVLVTAIVSPLLAKLVDRPSRSSASRGSRVQVNLAHQIEEPSQAVS